MPRFRSPANRPHRGQPSHATNQGADANPHPTLVQEMVAKKQCHCCPLSGSAVVGSGREQERGSKELSPERFTASLLVPLLKVTFEWFCPGQTAPYCKGVSPWPAFKSPTCPLP